MKSMMPSLRITDTHSFGAEKNGEWLLIECEDTAGKHFTLRIPHQIELGFFARFQAAVMLAAERRKSTPDRDISGAMFVERIAIGLTQHGKVSLVVKLAMGLELEMHLPDEAMEHLRQSLEELDTAKKAGGSRLTH
jgi:hypothetical protein